jgi:hypothetical protein
LDSTEGFGLWLRPVGVSSTGRAFFYLFVSPFPILRSFSVKDEQIVVGAFGLRFVKPAQCVVVVKQF